MSKQEKGIVLLVGILLVCAYACRIPNVHTTMFALIRSFIYIGLYIAWCVSLNRRIIHTKTRRYLTVIPVLMVFWFIIRTLKFSFIPDTQPDLIRYIWYFYYLPMLFIPMLAVLVALSLGGTENSRLPGWAKLIWIPTGVLFLLVMTNDLHQLVFTFPQNTVAWTDKNYGYAAGYGVVSAWILLCALFLFVIIWNKCRVLNSRKRIWQPLIPVCCLLVYVVFYYLRSEVLLQFFGDMTAIFCLMYAATLELCIQCGLIQSNTHYRELFHATSLGALITDDAYRPYLSSRNIRQVSESVLRQTEKEPVLLEGGIRLCAADIRGGHIFWQEDVSDMLTVLEQLNDTQEELQEYSVLLEEERKQKQQRCELEEQKRLYEAVEQIVSPAMERLGALIALLDKAEDEKTAKNLHGKIAIVGAYIKRRSNLVFLANESGAVSSARELLLCLNESISNLRLAGTDCAISLDPDANMNSETAGLLYDFFEAAVEAAWKNLPALNVVVKQTDKGWQMTLILQCEADFSSLARRFATASIEQDEELCYCKLAIPRGGALA